MAKVSLNKSSLQKQREQLKLYKKLLPSLDMKRRQLTVERNKARAALAGLEARMDEIKNEIGRQIPMLALRQIDVSGLVFRKGVETGIENVVGVKLPMLERVEFDDAPYALLGKPAWVDIVVDRLKEAAEAQARIEVGRERVEILEKQVRSVTQRVNLFDKILIPGAQEDIRRIQIFLADKERAMVVQSKIAKKLRQEQSRALREQAAEQEEPA